MIPASDVVYGLHEHQVSNWWVFGGTDIGIGLLWWLSMGNVERAWEMPVWFLVRCVTTSTVSFPLFYVRMIGAGGVKLMAIICGFLGPWDRSLSIIYRFLIEVAMSLIKMLVQRTLFRRPNYLYTYVRRLILTEGVTTYHDPFKDGYTHTISSGLCLFLGALAYLFFIKG